jgi:hypothetical protein
LESARVLAERTLRPWGSSGPTPLDAWRCEKAVSDAERRRFRGRVAKRGVERALADAGLVTYRSRWVPKVPWMRRNTSKGK